MFSMKTNKPKTPLRYIICQEKGRRCCQAHGSRRLIASEEDDVAEKNGRKFKFLLGHGHLVKNDLFSLCPPIGIALNYNYEFIHSWTSSYFLNFVWSWKCILWNWTKKNHVEICLHKWMENWRLFFVTVADSFFLIELQGRNQLLYKLCDLLSQPIFYQSESEYILCASSETRIFKHCLGGGVGLCSVVGNFFW